MPFATLKKLIFAPRAWMRYGCVVLLATFFAVSVGTAEDGPQNTAVSFRPMRLEYRVEWRLVTAGTANLSFTRQGEHNVQISMDLQSTGLLSRLYRVMDTYHAITNEHFCLSSAHLDAQEGKRHMDTQLNIDSGRAKSEYQERDLLKNTTRQVNLNVASCTYDITGALAAIREVDIAPGKSTTMPITDGKKFARVQIVAQAKEAVMVNDKKYQTTRYEALLFDNVLYKRRGTLQVWVSDDAERVPVMMHFQFGFPIGTVSVELLKQQDL